MKLINYILLKRMHAYAHTQLFNFTVSFFTYVNQLNFVAAYHSQHIYMIVFDCAIMLVSCTCDRTVYAINRN
jgi:hypothetical protein